MQGNVNGMQVEEEERAPPDYEATSPRSSIADEPMEDCGDGVAHDFGFDGNGADDFTQDSTRRPWQTMELLNLLIHPSRQRRRRPKRRISRASRATREYRPSCVTR